MDPRNVGPQQRQSNQSALMKALGKKSLGEQVNFCPFGCTDDELDQNGYCDHLVGFTTDGKTMEPMLKRPDGSRFVDGSSRQQVQKTDKLERITVSSRVYRDVRVKEKQPA